MLCSYQENWRAIHEDLQAAAKQAQDVDTRISSVHQNTKLQYAFLNDFVSELSGLKDLKEQLEQTIQHVSK